jgi:hypothetical protein
VQIIVQVIVLQILIVQIVLPRVVGVDEEGAIDEKVRSKR